MLLKFVGQDGEDKAMLNWFAVHGTCMNNTNKLISGDNKGFASYMVERDMNGKDVQPGKGKYVAAFASTNLGDVSPNTQGPVCHSGPNEGQPCDFTSSTCKDDKGKDKNEACYRLVVARSEKRNYVRRRRSNAVNALFAASVPERTCSRAPRLSPPTSTSTP